MRLVIIWFFLASLGKLNSQSSFVKTNSISFSIQNQVYTFIGANYWYGGYLAADTANKGYQRLTEELDFLKKHGITNLRVLFSGEGDASYPYRISPSVQEKKGIYNESILRSFDQFLDEVSKRNMKAILVLNNNWEWSGGFGQYLEWAGYSQPILPKTSNWDWGKYCDYIAQFYSCDSCQIWYRTWIEKIVNRKNTINHKYYKQDPAIMAWQLANEPRPMRPENKQIYKNWIKKTSEFLKSLDSHHLVSIGSEGAISSAMDTMLYREIHALPSIDYFTIHLWPKTWQWYNGAPSHAIADTTLEKTKSYILWHAELSRTLNKPMVIEEFGLHRDDNGFLPSTTVTNRNHYYTYIFHIGKKEKIAGYNFWGAMAFRDPKLIQDFWQKGLPYSADPPQEEQGLYGVFITDTSTWNVIKKFKP